MWVGLVGVGGRVWWVRVGVGVDERQCVAESKQPSTTHPHRQDIEDNSIN
jgi:hypothetical protein